MSNIYAIVQNGVVVNMAVADAPIDSTWILDTVGATMGWTYDGTNFIAPPPPPAPPAPTSIYITAYAYASRFTQAERVAIRTAGQTNIQVQDYLEMLNLLVNNGVNLLDPQLAIDVNALETAGLIATGRAAQILSTTLAPGEVFIK